MKQRRRFVSPLSVSHLLVRESKRPVCSSAGTRISTFTQADLVSRSVQYLHTSQEEKHADQFSFVVSDGTNEVSPTSSAV